MITLAPPSVTIALRSIIIDGVQDDDLFHGSNAFALLYFDDDELVETYLGNILVPAGHYIVSENSNTGEADAMRFPTRDMANEHWQTMVEWCAENEPYLSPTDRDY